MTGIKGNGLSIRAIIVAIMTSGLLGGCSASHLPPFKDYTAQLIGTPLVDLQLADAQPGSYVSKSDAETRTYPLENGDSVYVSPLRKDCIVYWQVDPQGMIIGYRSEGARCD